MLEKIAELMSKKDFTQADVYALLTPESHHLLNYLEDNYVSDFNEINELLLSLNRSVKPPTKEYYEEMNAILKRVRKKLKNERRGRR